MTTDRGRLHALTTLLEQREAGGYTLPSKLLDAHAVLHAARALPLPAPEQLHPDAAASLALGDLVSGRTPDLDDLGERIEESTRAARRQQVAQQVAQAVVEQATSHVLLAAMDYADKVVVEHLRPAFVAVLELATRHADALAGQSMEPRALLTAPAKVRTAYLELQRLAERYTLLRSARQLANTAGLRQVQHDSGGEFATFADPHALTGYTPGGTARPPQIDYPSDIVELLLWLVGPAAIGKPWLPTVTEQDAAWWDAYGQGVTQRRDAAVFAESVGARGAFAVGPTAA